MFAGQVFGPRQGRLGLGVALGSGKALVAQVALGLGVALELEGLVSQELGGRSAKPPGRGLWGPNPGGNPLGTTGTEKKSEFCEDERDKCLGQQEGPEPGSELGSEKKSESCEEERDKCLGSQAQQEKPQPSAPLCETELYTCLGSITEEDERPTNEPDEASLLKERFKLEDNDDPQ
jgi:hypothetical protein